MLVLAVAFLIVTINVILRALSCVLDFVCCENTVTNIVLILSRQGLLLVVNDENGHQSAIFYCPEHSNPTSRNALVWGLVVVFSLVVLLLLDLLLTVSSHCSGSPIVRCKIS